MTTTDTFALTEPQIHHYRTFGFVKLPGLFTADEMDRMSRAFDEVFATAETTPLDPGNEVHNARDEAYADDVRQMVFHFLDQSPDLVWLRDDARVTGIVRSLLGDNTEEMPADGNIMNCDVSYHSDAYGSGLAITNIKIFFYLDALDRHTGALRMIPGTNHHPSDYARLVRTATVNPEKTVERLGVADEELPSFSVDVVPGDIIVGDFRTVHGSFKGAPGRRLFTLNYRDVATVEPDEN